MMMMVVMTARTPPMKMMMLLLLGKRNEKWANLAQNKLLLFLFPAFVWKLFTLFFHVQTLTFS